MKHLLWGFALLMTFAINATGQSVLSIQGSPPPQNLSPSKCTAKVTEFSVPQSIPSSGELLPETVKSSERKYLLIQHNFNADAENGRVKHAKMRQLLFEKVGKNFVNHLHNQNAYVVQVQNYSAETLQELQTIVHQQMVDTQFKVISLQDFDRLNAVEIEYIHSLEKPKH